MGRHQHDAGIGINLPDHLRAAPHRVAAEPDVPVVEIGPSLRPERPVLGQIGRRLPPHVPGGAAELGAEGLGEMRRALEPAQPARLARAQQLLESTDESVEAIAGIAGFGSTASLRQHFAEAFRTSPSAWRREFRGV